MSKTRRNFAAAHRHIKGDDDNSNQRFNRFVKKMEKRSSVQDYDEREESYGKINHKNYDRYMDEEDDDSYDLLDEDIADTANNR